MSPARAEWTLETSPAAYLERYPEGPNADLARETLEAEEEGPESSGLPDREELAERLEAIRDEWERLHFERLGQELRVARTALESPRSRAAAKWRADHSTAIGRDLTQVELRLHSTPRSRTVQAIEAIRTAMDRLPELDLGEPLWRDGEHEVLSNFTRAMEPGETW